MRILTMLILVAVLCAGCGAEMTEEAQQKIHFVKAEQEIGDRTPEERALIIKNRLSQVDGIDGTAVVVEGKTAIIGLRLENGMEQNEVDAVRRKVDTLAKHADVQIENTSVTTNGDIVSMIEEMERKRSG